MFVLIVAAVTLASIQAEHCSQAGNRCCSQAILSCPHLGSGENCRAEHWQGISSGPACNEDYVYTHCVNGRMYGCIVTEQCNCETGGNPQKVGTEHEHVPQKNSSDEAVRLNAVGQIIQGPAPTCSAAGNVCCSDAIRNCPHKDSVARCSAERLQGIDDGPECAAKINYEHCVNGAHLYCLREKHCDCDAAPMPTSLQQPYDAKFLEVHQVPRSSTSPDLVQDVLPSILVVGAIGLALAATAIGRAAAQRRYSQTDDLEERKSFVEYASRGTLQQ